MEAATLLLREIMELPTFRRELLAILARRTREAGDYGRMFAAPNSFYHIIMGQREPTDQDFIVMSAYLDVSEEYLRSMFNGEVSISETIPPPVGGG